MFLRGNHALDHRRLWKGSVLFKHLLACRISLSYVWLEPARLCMGSGTTRDLRRQAPLAKVMRRDAPLNLSLPANVTGAEAHPVLDEVPRLDPCAHEVCLRLLASSSRHRHSVGAPQTPLVSLSSDLLQGFLTLLYPCLTLLVGHLGIDFVGED